MEGEELFAEVKNEGDTLDIDKAFERLSTKEEKTAPESQPEKKETDEPASRGDNTLNEITPFHKHPRWIKTQETLKQYETRIAEFEKKLEEAQKGAASELPKWWVDANGDDEESRARYQAITKKDGELDWLKQNILGELDQRTQAEKTQEVQATEYVDSQLAEMTDEGLKFDRNTLLKFMVDFQKEFGEGSLLDKDGNYDFRKALALQEKMEPKEPDKTTETKKQLAGNAGRSKVSSGSSSKIPVVSTRALRKGGWREAGI